MKKCYLCKKDAKVKCHSCETAYCSDICFELDWNQAHQRKCGEEQTLGKKLTIEHTIGPSENLTIINDTFQDILEPQPFFILSFGPPGSGKSTVLGKILADLEIPSTTLVKILIDDFIAKYSGYKSAIAALTREWKADKLDTSAFIEASEEAYWFYRNNGATAVEESVKLTAFRERYNIIKETTGQKYGSTVEKVVEAKKKNYRTMLVYPFVSTDQLVERIKKRAEETGRFPDPAKLAAQVSSAQKTFLQVYEKFDIVLVIDNDKVMSQTGVLAKINKTSSSLSSATCDARRMQDFIRSGDMIDEFAEFIKKNCN